MMKNQSKSLQEQSSSQRSILPHTIDLLILDYLLESKITSLYHKLRYDLVCKRWFLRVSSFADTNLKVTLVRDDNTIYSFLQHIINPHCVWKNITRLNASSVDGDIFLGPMKTAITDHDNNPTNQQLNQELIRMLTTTLKTLEEGIVVEKLFNSYGFKYIRESRTETSPLLFSFNQTYFQSQFSHPLANGKPTKQFYDEEVTKCMKVHCLEIYIVSPINNESLSQQLVMNNIKTIESLKVGIQAVLISELIDLLDRSVVVEEDGKEKGHNIRKLFIKFSSITPFDELAEKKCLTFLSRHKSIKRLSLTFALESASKMTSDMVSRMLVALLSNLEPNQIEKLSLTFNGSVPYKMSPQAKELLENIPCKYLQLPVLALDFKNNHHIRHLFITSGDCSIIFNSARYPPPNLVSFNIEPSDTPRNFDWLSHKELMITIPQLQTISSHGFINHVYPPQSFSFLLSNKSIRNLVIPGMHITSFGACIDALYKRALVKDPEPLPNLDYVHLQFRHLDIGEFSHSTLKLLVNQYHYSCDLRITGVLVNLYLFNKSIIN